MTGTGALKLNPNFVPALIAKRAVIANLTLREHNVSSFFSKHCTVVFSNARSHLAKLKGKVKLGIITNRFTHMQQLPPKHITPHFQVTSLTALDDLLHPVNAI